MLKQLQEAFYQDILTPSEAKNYQDNGNFTGIDLIQIYHHQYFMSLTEGLAKTYSCVKRLVGENFFKSLATDFIKTQPSKTPNIIDYGEAFSIFIAQHPHCQDMPYLIDMAKFERLYERCYFSTDAIFFMCSDYPIIKIWQLNENSTQLDLFMGGDCLKIHKKSGKVVVEKITKQVYNNEQNN
ncbi:MAG: DNA-binding domain-containing protein [Gammaproteobacteria bacterium]|nr:DNA-binding domain-containing protein [Gammaproteobacteria bacterium]